MATVSPFLLAVVVLVIFLAIVLIIIVIVNMQASKVIASSTQAAANCTAAPAKPVNVVVTNPQGDILAVSWSPVAFATSYTVYVGITAGFPTSSAVSTKTTVRSATSFGNLSVGVQYYIKLTASNNCGTSSLSPEVSFIIPYNYPSTFTITSTVNSILEACWSDNIISPTYQESASRFCNATTANVNYNLSDKTVRLASDNSRCLTRRAGGTVFMDPCTANSTQTWAYFNSTSTLCSPTSPTTECLLITSPVDPLSVNPLKHGAPSTPDTTEWTLVGV